MKPIYDYVFVTHLPAFYKVNLYREIAKQCRIFVIFIASGSTLRTHDFVSSLESFDHIILNEGPFEARQIINSLRQLHAIMCQIRYRSIVLGGWDLPEFWALALLSPLSKNTLALESSVYDSQYHGWARLLKRVFLSRIKTVFASGTPHRALLKALKFQGNVFTTLGVGIFNTFEKSPITRTFQGRFLYVGRLAVEKNIYRLLDVFRQLPQFTLSIAGQGPLQADLQKACPANVHLLGHISNHQLASCYQDHDIFILPSLKEPWGLVVEEALYYGLPVIASNRVGCALDWVERYKVGMLFEPLDNHSIEEAILWSAEHYDSLRHQIKQINFASRDSLQISRYLEALP